MKRTLGLLAAALLIVAVPGARLLPAEYLARLQAWLAPHEPEQSRTFAHGTGPGSGSSRHQTSASAPATSTDAAFSARPLRLYLAATFPGRNPAEGSARIGTSIENPQTYSAGALLSNGARLSEIHHDHVVLVRGGESAKLYQYQHANHGHGTAATANPLLAEPATAPPRVLASNQELITDYIRPTPLYDDQRLIGYQIYPGRKAGVFYLLGLRPGNVITELNGVPVTAPAETIGLFRQLAKGMAVRASVMRDAVQLTITLDGELIIADLETGRLHQSSAAAPSHPSGY